MSFIEFSFCFLKNYNLNFVLCFFSFLYFFIHEIIHQKERLLLCKNISLMNSVMGDEIEITIFSKEHSVKRVFRQKSNLTVDQTKCLFLNRLRVDPARMDQYLLYLVHADESETALEGSCSWMSFGLGPSITVVCKLQEDSEPKSPINEQPVLFSPSIRLLPTLICIDGPAPSERNVRTATTSKILALEASYPWFRQLYESQSSLVSLDLHDNTFPKRFW
jgi:hypothetical protein